MYLGLDSKYPATRASSRELLEHVLEQPLRGAVLALVDDMPDVERFSSAEPLHQLDPLPYAALLGALLDSGSETLQCLAAYHVGELGLEQLRPQLEQIPHHRIRVHLERRPARARPPWRSDREVIHSVRAF